MRQLFFLLVGFILGMTGCSSSVDSLENVPQKVLHSSLEKLMINGRTLTLNTNLWRDFAPSSPANGRPLIARIEVLTSNGSTLPGGLDTDTVWVIVDNEVWRSAYSDEIFQGDDHRIVKIARGGPKFNVGNKAVVVVRITYRGKDYLLRSSDQQIQQTM